MMMYIYWRPMIFHPEEYRRLFLESVYNSRDMRNCIDESVAVDADSEDLDAEHLPLAGRTINAYIVEGGIGR